MKWINDARECIKNSSKESSIYIGADSVRFKKGYNKVGDDRWFAKYATVIVVHHNSSNGAAVFHTSKTLPDYCSIRTRLLTEVQMSLQAFDGIESVIGDRHLEVHLDVNPDPVHASNVVAKQAAGWVASRGLIHKIKNEAWAASTAADYCANGRVFKKGVV